MCKPSPMEPIPDRDSRPERTAAASVAGRPCSVAAALQVVGERWALLAIREINFGNHRFGEIVRNTGAPRDVLTARLRALEQAGVVYRRLYQERPARFEYHLTEAGADLRPVINGLRRWGDRWIVDEPPVLVEHHCGQPLEVASHCVHCGEAIDPAHSDEWSERFVAPGWDRGGPVEG